MKREEVIEFITEQNYTNGTLFATIRNDIISLYNQKYIKRKTKENKRKLELAQNNLTTLFELAKEVYTFSGSACNPTYNRVSGKR